MNPPIKIDRLSKTYKGKHNKPALQALSLTLNEGEIFGFLGPNGSGKSTTIKCLMGLIKPTSGTAYIMGKECHESQSHLQVGFLPENPAFYEFLSGLEYLKFVLNIYSKKNTLPVDDLLRKYELFDARKKLIRTYSKGMVQRLGLIQTLIHDPDLLIWDEPMSGLDPLGRALVKKQMLELKGQGKTIFFSTHITADVEAVCDRVGIIVSGKLQCVENVQHIMEVGIYGYDVRYTKKMESTIYSEEVSTDLLNDFLRRCEASNYTIILIEPLRQNLEDFFLEVVNS